MKLSPQQISTQISQQNQNFKFSLSQSQITFSKSGNIIFEDLELSQNDSYLYILNEILFEIYNIESE